ncbi:MAG: phosphoadenosine phosphosulfate reductase family protein [Acidobacteria bacterium]|nr:phosphoadenosine phosphosulfate reductase family protein [Acidobacteriota bacterium]
MTNHPSLFEELKLTLREAIELTAESLTAYGSRYRHWCAAYSMGKDSTTMITVAAHLISEGRIPAPQSFTILLADTLLENPALFACAKQIMNEMRELGFDVRIVKPALDHRFFVYMFGRGVPPPSNRFRWCTEKLKVLPMKLPVEEIAREKGEKVLTLTGVRLGESAQRDLRIITSCTRDGGECGQGWYQESLPASATDILAPILHWRPCNVWAWLQTQAPALGFSTRLICEAYGGLEAENINTRTGCIGCNLVTEDRALEVVLKQPGWSYLAPLRGLRQLYAELKKPGNRLRKPGGDKRKDGTLASKQQRMGPLTFDARRYGLSVVLDIQQQVNNEARLSSRPEIRLITDEERTRIEFLIAENTWPDGWSGTEPRADVPHDKVYNDGSVAPLLIK